MANVKKIPYATRLCLSGVESRRLLDTFKEFKVKHIQVSFYYLRRVFHDPLDFEPIAKQFETVVIDSGTVYGNVKNTDERKRLLEDYASYLGALDKHSFHAAVYEEGVGIDKVLPDEMLIYPLDDVREVFDNDLRALFNNLKYVGVSNKECSAHGGDNLIPIFAQASKTGSYIHAFGTGSKRILQKYPFYSANSSSWRSGSRYLNTYIYEGPGRGLRLYQPHDKKDPVKTEKELKTIRRRQESLVKVRHPLIYPQIDWSELHEGDSWEVDKANLAQWMLYAQDLELLPHNKYFLTEQERQEVILRKTELLANITPKGDTEEGEEVDAHPVENSQADEVEIIAEDSPQILESLSKELEKPDNPGGRISPVDDRMRTLRQCDFCILAGRCPKYTPGGLCAFGLPPANPTYDHTHLEEHIMEDAADLLAIQKDRILQLYLEEKTDASGVSKDLTVNMKLYMEMVALLSEATDKRDEISVKAKGAGVLDMFKKRGEK